MTSIYEKKNSAEVKLIHAEQMSLYNFIIFQKKNKKTIETDEEKHVAYYYVIKNYVGHKLVIFNAVLLFCTFFNKKTIFFF